MKWALQGGNRGREDLVTAVEIPSADPTDCGRVLSCWHGIRFRRGHTPRVGDVQAAPVVLCGIHLHHSARLGLINAFSSGIDAALAGSPEEPSIVGSVVNLVLGTLLSMGATAFYLAAPR
jgi:hypothetical protein